MIRGIEVVDLLAGELEIDMWRFQLPALTLPELATSAYEDGKLVVTVPKDLNSDGSDFDHSGARRLVYINLISCFQFCVVELRCPFVEFVG